MPMAERGTRQRLYMEYIQLDDKYRDSLEHLAPSMLTHSNRYEFERLIEMGGQLESKLREVQEAFGAKRFS